MCTWREEEKAGEHAGEILRTERASKGYRNAEVECLINGVRSAPSSPPNICLYQGGTSKYLPRSCRDVNTSKTRNMTHILVLIHYSKSTKCSVLDLGSFQPLYDIDHRLDTPKPSRGSMVNRIMRSYPGHITSHQNCSSDERILDRSPLTVFHILS
jgi:hypothetical protein